ncbi:hypothetical protein [Christiangramia forsetii]|uniref:Membrane protein n=2 Tax=Christiangramia forsetii TaxID=411153 RepID=A0M726_CHRFK|nr:hypothetical protein [Christiangramia forsetii]GGG28879.1 hypothetical protein GCM10011532_10430 [Christiangramia forsetii]CAL68421.1 membrane protein [Christiangramia forsetii KT0803]
MENFLEYLSAIWPLTPLFLFIIAVSFRLLDNSTYLFLQKDILVNNSNVSRNLLKKQIRSNEDSNFTKQLKRALLYRNLQQSFMIAAAISLPFSFICYFLS